MYSAQQPQQQTQSQQQNWKLLSLIKRDGRKNWNSIFWFWGKILFHFFLEVVFKTNSLSMSRTKHKTQENQKSKSKQRTNSRWTTKIFCCVHSVMKYLRLPLCLLIVDTVCVTSLHCDWWNWTRFGVQLLKVQFKRLWNHSKKWINLWHNKQPLLVQHQHHHQQHQ